MKCINKWICLSLLIAVSCVSGCGKTSAAIEQPYDVYATAADFGLSSNGTAEAKSYFASDLCVSEDVVIGTDSTDSHMQILTVITDKGTLRSLLYLYG